MNSSMTIDLVRAGRARRGPAALARLAGAAVIAAVAAPAPGQATNQPGESDLYRRSGETSGRAATQQTSAIYRERQGAYDKDAWQRAWQDQGTTTRQHTVTYQQASNQTLPAAHPDDAAYTRGDRSLSQGGMGMQQQPMVRPAAYQQPQTARLNLPPASPEYISDFNRPGDAMVMRAEAPRTQTTESRTTTVSQRVAPPPPAPRRRGVSYGDVNYYSEIGYGEFSHYSDFQDAPNFPEPGDAGAARTESVAAKKPATVTPAATTQQYRGTTTTETIYYSDDADLEWWLDQSKNNNTNR